VFDSTPSTGRCKARAAFMIELKDVNTANES
jgi:hypothetical protein